MPLPEKDYFSLEEIAERWRLPLADLEYWIEHLALSAFYFENLSFERLRPGTMRDLKRKKRKGRDVGSLEFMVPCEYEDVLITREERDRFEREHAIGPIYTAANTREGRPLASKERENLLRTIGALALLLIETKRSRRLGTRDKTNINALKDEILRVLDELGVSTEGQSKSTLYQVIPEAIRVALKE